MAAGDERMADDWIAFPEPGDTFADLFNPAGVFMPHNIGQVNVGLLAPDAFDDMKIRAADAGTADSYDYIRGGFDTRIDDIFVGDEFLGGQRLVVLMENGGFHLPVPSFLSAVQHGFDISPS